MSTSCGVCRARKSASPWLLALCALLVLPSCGGKSPTSPNAPGGGSQPPTTMLFTLGGIVISVTTGQGIEGVRVLITDGPHQGQTATTDASGNYSIGNVSGAMTVSAKRGGFAEQLKPANVTANTTLNFELTEEATGVRGRVTDILGGGPLEGVTVTVPGHDSVTTASDGTYSLDLMGAFGQLPIAFDAAGFWTRQSNVSVNSFANAETGLIPMGGDFDMGFFDHLFRDKGADGTQRWLGTPTIEIWQRRFTCKSATGGTSCSEMEATANNILPFFETHVRNAAADTGALTGGFIVAPPVTMRTHNTGDTVREAQFFRDGVISVAYVTTTFSTSSWAVWRVNDNNEIVTGHVQINEGHSNIPCVFVHEIAHNLGYHHPDGQLNVPRPSVMRCDGVTADDRLHGRVLYLRPPDSRTPDIDPAGFALGLAAMRFGGAGLRTFVAQ